ncbi:LysR family transcriptional regulator [Oceanobacter mangrovi]|uniref:LysR family transcriptional regulator n=1 Tax=Oceanobacter mangrovi TaxID=2862510 RepID=UPI001C8E74BE|nr:LysR family transcriptional regulator [Oceanobacter mangrovi]
MALSFHQFDLNLLRVFEALVSEAHVTRAAEKVFLSQSATSHALNRLRKQLDDPILVRCGNGLQPTPRALAMLGEVRDVLRRLEQTLAPPRAFDPATSKRVFTLAVTDYFEAVVLPDLMPALQQLAPGLVFNLEMIGPQASLARLESGEVDLVVGLDDSFRIPSHLQISPWREEEPVCLVGSQFDDLPAALDLSAYLALPHAVMLDQSDASTINIDSIDRWLEANKLKRRIVVQMINYLAAARTVANCRAVLTLPRQMAEMFCSWLPVRLLEAPDELPNWNMKLIQHPLYQQDGGIQWLLEQLRQPSSPPQ